MLQLYLEGAHERFVNTHHAACIVKLPAVVWSREKCDQLAFGKELISILHNLREDTWHYSAAYSDQYQETDLQLHSQSSISLKVECNRTTSTKRNPQPWAEIVRANHLRAGFSVVQTIN